MAKSIKVPSKVSLKAALKSSRRSTAPARNSKRPVSVRRSPPIDASALIHPELREGTLAAQEVFAALGPLSDRNLAAFRKAMGQWARPYAEDVPVQKKLIPGSGGHKVPAYIVNARQGASRPAILHMHGGGFVAGAAGFEVRNQQDLAAALDCVSVTVDYRLAPQADWRMSLADNYAALRWVYAHAADLGVDSTRIAVMGESAGGTHAALLAIEARNRGEVTLALQFLLYPALDDRTGSSRPVPAHVDKFIWTSESHRYGWGAFLGKKPGSRSVPSAAVPARVADLSGVAPAFICVGSLDLLADENMEYARRLSGVGVPIELHVVPGAVHGFEEFAPESSLVHQFVALKMGALRRAFGLPVG